MSVKKEPSGRRSIQVEVEVPGTPEEVWRAIATGPGVSSWFVPTKCDEREGGQVVSTFGPGMDCPAKITAWQPPKRFAAEAEMGPPGTPMMATEWSVEARAGGVCLVRVVHSLFASTDDWDNQLDGLEQGWPTYFRILLMRLSHYKGMPCSAMQFVAMSSEQESKAWENAGGALALLRVAEGQGWTAPEGLPHMAGVVDLVGKGVHPNTVLLRLEAPSPGAAYVGAFSCGGMVMVCMNIYLYGAKAKAAVNRDEPAWQKWMGERFPMPPAG
ncbi:MAG: SRPBCC domain-containing protein [Planctomycetes bacterium]|nr:SRPBCC domain-containing protein [Planctomycetota bacterium]MBI3835716.1 SRPBCC domain-containing protein [Planctomycetota bacterium]